MPKGFYQTKQAVKSEELKSRIENLKTIRSTLLKIHPDEDSHEAIVALDERICWLQHELDRAHWQWVE